MIKRILISIVTIFLCNPLVNAEDGAVTKKTIKTIDGEIIKLGEIIGKKPVYLKFWASWCMHCREQMPHLQRSFEQYGDNVEIIAININMNDSLDAVKIIRQEFQLSVPIVMDDDAVLAKTYNLIATPYHVLINKEGEIIYTGHDVTDKLDKNLQLLATGYADNLKKVSLNKTSSNTNMLNFPKNKTTMLFFTSAWCDWYLEKSRPNMASQCVTAQNQISSLSAKYPELNWQGVLTRLWTGEKELNEYKKKYNVPFPVSVDETNKYFFDFKVNFFPTLIALKNGKEIFRINTFNDTTQLQRQLMSLITPVSEK